MRSIVRESPCCPMLYNPWQMFALSEDGERGGGVTVPGRPVRDVRRCRSGHPVPCARG
ncbi:hypothetical protein [Prevotella sp. AGR2160]|uniref:hypothetical protein n=1 Tax=Prevotella sp. AGR2160 TaxID=1280674 RepID=UPI0018CB3981|nr:hypothetical protein [Prevotella sp. AGR2160]